jgi:hypothetical protein
VKQRSQELRIEKIRVGFPLARKQYTLVQVRQSSQFRAQMQHLMALLAEAQQVAAVMLATTPADQMVDLHAPPHV